jgi:hypothetical protein
MYRKIFFLSFPPRLLGLGYISENFTKDIFESIYIYLWEIILANYVDTTEYILDWGYHRLQNFVHIRF